MTTTDVEGNIAAFNSLNVGGLPVSGGGTPQSFCWVRSNSQSIADSTLGTVNTFVTVANTNPAALSPNSNTGIIINQAGVYHVTSYISWQSGSVSGVRQLILTVNGAIVAFALLPSVAGGSGGTITRNITTFTWSQQFNVGDVLGLQAYQDSGSINVVNPVNMQVWR